MNMDVRQTSLPGCQELIPKVVRDDRGSFAKTFHEPTFLAHGLWIDFKEEYFSLSRRGVLRGLHFQTPPHEHVKIVYCPQGQVRDVVLDLRVGSPTYGRWETVVLDGEKGNMLYIPAGFAHGFHVTSDSALMMYKVSTVYSPENDKGILWSSIGFDWGVSAPLVSPRDAAFPPFSQFESPFTYRQQ